jgi:hypothetical protein
VRPAVESQAKRIRLKRSKEVNIDGKNPGGVAVSLDWFQVASPSSAIRNEIGRVGYDQVERFGWKLRQDLSTIAVIEGDAVEFKVGNKGQSVCSKTAPLAEGLEQAIENRVFSIAIH